MKIKILAVSKIEKIYKPIMDEYLKMISGFAEIELQEIKESAIKSKDTNNILKEESSKILNAMPQDCYKVVLAIDGKHYDSVEFSQELENIRDFEGGKAVFIIGGPLGLHKDVLDVADLKLSLSKMTLPHQLARIFILEQIYRGFSILSGAKYHK